MININLCNKNINCYEIKVNLYFYFPASHSRSTKTLWWRARNALGVAPGFFCTYALKAWNMFSCLFQTESVENFLLAFLGFSRFLQNQESLDTPVFPGIFPGFSACAKKGWKPRNVIPEFCRIPGSFSSREDKKMKLPFKMMWALFFSFPSKSLALLHRRHWLIFSSGGYTLLYKL